MPPDELDEMDGVDELDAGVPRPMPVNQFDAVLRDTPLPAETREAFDSRLGKLGKLGVLGPARLPANEQERQADQRQADATRTKLAGDAEREAAGRAREAAMAARKAEVEQRRAAREQAAAAKEAERNQHAYLADQGVEFEVTPEGGRVPSKHADGTIKFNPSALGDPRRDEETGRAVQDFRDDRGRTVAQDLEKTGKLHLDRETGERYAVGAAGQRISFGLDEAFVEQKRISANIGEQRRAADEAAAVVAEMKAAGRPVLEGWTAAQKRTESLRKQLENAEKAAANPQYANEPGIQERHAKLAAEWAKEEPGYTGAEKAAKEHAAAVESAEKTVREQQKKTRALSSDLDRLKNAKWLPAGVAKPVAHAAEDRVEELQADFTAKKAEAAKVRSAVIGTIEQPGIGNETVTAAKKALEAATAPVKEAAAKLVAMKTRLTVAEKAAADYTAAAEKAAPALANIEQARLLLFSKQVDGAMSSEAAATATARLDAAEKEARAPLAPAEKRHKAAVSAVAEFAVKPEEWEQTPERQLALAEVLRQAAEYQASGQGTEHEGAVKALEVFEAHKPREITDAEAAPTLAPLKEHLTEQLKLSPGDAKLTADLAKVNRQIATLKKFADTAGRDYPAEAEKLKAYIKEQAARSKSVNPAWEAAATVMAVSEKEQRELKGAAAAQHAAGVATVARELVEARDGGKARRYGHHGDTAGMRAARDELWNSTVEKYQAEQADPKMGTVEKAVRGTLRVLQGAANPVFLSIAGKTLEDVQRTNAAREAFALIGNLDQAGAEGVLRAMPALEEQWKSNGSILSEAEREAEGDYEGKASAIRVAGGGKSDGNLAQLTRTMGGVENMIRDLEKGKISAKVDTGTAALINGFLFMGDGKIEIDENDPAQVARRAFLLTKLAETVEKQAGGSALAGSVIGSVSSFMGAGFVGRALARGGFAARGIEAGTKAERIIGSAATGALMGTDMSAKESPNDIGAMNRAFDIAMKGTSLMLSEAFGDLLQGKIERILAKPAVMRGLSKFGGRVEDAARKVLPVTGKLGGGLTGEMSSDAVEALMRGEDPVAGLGDSFKGNAGMVIGMWAVNALTKARVRKIGGKPTAGAVEAAHDRLEAARKAMDAAEQSGDTAGAVAALRELNQAHADIETSAKEALAISPKVRRNLSAALGADHIDLETALEDNPALRLGGIALGQNLGHLYVDEARRKAAEAAVGAEVDFGGDAGGMAAAVVDQHVGAMVARDMAAVANGTASLTPEKTEALVNYGLVVAGADGGVHLTEDAVPFLPSAMRSAIKAEPSKHRVIVTPGATAELANHYIARGHGSLVKAAKVVTAAQAAALGTVLGVSPAGAAGTGAAWSVSVKSQDDGGRTFERDYPVQAGTEAEAVAKVRAQVEGMGRTVIAASAKQVDAGGGASLSQGNEDSETSDAEAASSGGAQGNGGRGAAAPAVASGVRSDGGKSKQAAGAAAGNAGGGAVGADRADRGAAPGSRWYSGLGKRSVKRLAALERAGVAVEHTDGPSMARLEPDGKTSILINVQARGVDVEAVADEEIKHHFDNEVMAAEWRAAVAAGTFKGDAQEYRAARTTEIFHDLRSRIGGIKDAAERESAEAAVVGAFNVYYGKLAGDPPLVKTVEQALQLIADGLPIFGTKYHASVFGFGMELGRMLDQAGRRGQITEETHEVVRQGLIGQWVAKAIAAIKALAAKLLDMGHPLHASEMAALARESEALAGKWFARGGTDIEGESINTVSVGGETIETGGSWASKNPRGREVVRGTWALVPLRLLGVNKNFGADQDRVNREKTGAAQRSEIVSNMTEENIPLAWAESATLNDGSPIITPDGSVVVGNNRSMALRDLFATQPKKGRLYEKWAREEAARRGLDGDAFTDEPVVLVRVVSDTAGLERGEMVKAANKAGVAAKSEADLALEHAAVLDNPAVLATLNPGTDGSLNKDFLQSFARMLADRDVVKDSAGNLDLGKAEKAAGNAMLAVLLRGSKNFEQVLSSLITASGREGMKRMLAGVYRALPGLLKIQRLNPDAGILNELGRALAALPDYRAAVEAGRVKDVADYLAQGDMFDSPLAEGLMEFLADGKSAAEIAKELGDYVAKVAAQGDPAQEQMFAPAPVDKATLGGVLAKVAEPGSGKVRRLAALQAAARERKLRPSEEWERYSLERAAGQQFIADTAPDYQLDRETAAGNLHTALGEAREQMQLLAKMSEDALAWSRIPRDERMRDRAAYEIFSKRVKAAVDAGATQQEAEDRHPLEAVRAELDGQPMAKVAEYPELLTMAGVPGFGERRLDYTALGIPGVEQPPQMPRPRNGILESNKALDAWRAELAGWMRRYKGPLIFAATPERVGYVSPSVGKPGWRLTHFDYEVPVGHTDHPDKLTAVEDAVESYLRVDPGAVFAKVAEAAAPSPENFWNVQDASVEDATTRAARGTEARLGRAAEASLTPEMVAEIDAGRPVTFDNLPGSQPTPGLNRNQRLIETAFFKQISDNPQKALRAYFKLAKRETAVKVDGKVIVPGVPFYCNMDLAREMYAPYAQEKEARNVLETATPAPAGYLALNLAWNLWLRKGPSASRQDVLFMSGAMASGKTTAIGLALPGDRDAASLILDSVLGNEKAAADRIQEALDAGFAVNLVHVFRPYDLALDGVIGRINKEGRAVGLAQIPLAHYNAQLVFLKLADRFAGHPGFRAQLVINAGALEDIHKAEVDELRHLLYSLGDEKGNANETAGSPGLPGDWPSGEQIRPGDPATAEAAGADDASQGLRGEHRARGEGSALRGLLGIQGDKAARLARMGAIYGEKLAEALAIGILSQANYRSAFYRSAAHVPAAEQPMAKVPSITTGWRKITDSELAMWAERSANEVRHPGGFAEALAKANNPDIDFSKYEKPGENFQMELDKWRARNPSPPSWGFNKRQWLVGHLDRIGRPDEALEEIVEDAMEQERAAQEAPSSSPGFVGTVSEDGAVKIRKGPLDQINHEGLGFSREEGFPWRYNPKTQLVYWWNPASEETKEATATKLRERGQTVIGNRVITLHGPTWREAHGLPPEQGQPMAKVAERPYAGVPRTLMGFPKEGPTKPFHEQRYPFTLTVRVSWPDGDSMVEQVKGMNKAHALERARINWEGAEIEEADASEQGQPMAKVADEVEAAMTREEKRKVATGRELKKRGRVQINFAQDLYMNAPDLASSKERAGVEMMDRGAAMIHEARTAALARMPKRAEEPIPAPVAVAAPVTTKVTDVTPKVTDKTGQLGLFDLPAVKKAARVYVGSLPDKKPAAVRKAAREDGLGAHAEDLFSFAAKGMPASTPEPSAAPAGEWVLATTENAQVGMAIRDPDTGKDLGVIKSFRSGMSGALVSTSKHATNGKSRFLLRGMEIFQPTLTASEQTRNVTSNEHSEQNTSPGHSNPHRRDSAEHSPGLGLDDLFSIMAGKREAELRAGTDQGAEGGRAEGSGQSDVGGVDLPGHIAGKGSGDTVGDGGRAETGGTELGGRGERGGTGPGAGQPADGGGGRGADGDRNRGTRSGVDSSLPALVERPTEPEARNHVIPRGSPIAPRGLITKLKANIRAVKLLKLIQGEGRNATPEEKAELVQFTGWGAVSQAFDEDKAAYIKGGSLERKRTDLLYYREELARQVARGHPGDYYKDLAAETEEEIRKYENWEKKWGGYYEQIKNTLTEQEWRRARASTINAHYTAGGVVSLMWDAAVKMGFRGGNVGEMAVGIGHFFGLMPQELQDRSKLFGVEMDPISAGIAQLLYPEADIQASAFQQADVADNSLDLNIGNVPFANIAITDPAIKAMDGPLDNLHDYYFAKMLQKTRPGGMIVAISSAFTLDKMTATNRKWLAERADLVAAFRLPNDAFKENAGTEVVTDIIILRKKDGGAFEHGKEWISLGESRTAKGDPIRVNEYFAAHPQNVLGLLADDGEMFAGNKGAKEMTVHSDPNRPADVALAQAIEGLPSDIAGAGAWTEVRDSAPVAGIKMGNIVRAADGNFYFNTGGELTAAGMSESDKELNEPKNRPRVAAFLGVRDALNRQYDLELSETASDEEIEENRAELNRLYDAFKGRFDDFHHRANKSLLIDDPDYFRIAGAEIEAKVGPVQKMVNAVRGRKTYTKADVFRRRVLAPRVEPTHADTLEDAMGMALGWRGRVDIGYIAQLTGMTPEQAEQALLDREIVLRDPDTGQIQSREQYLAGNVRKKLEVARAAGAAYARNVRLLEAAQPADVALHDIKFSIGATWIPADIYQEFMRSIGLNTGIAYLTGGTGSDKWTVQDRGRTDASAVRYKDFESGRFGAPEMMDALLNFRRIEIRFPAREGGKVNPEATAQAQNKANELKEEFRRWANDAPGVGDRMAAIYNKEVNGHALRTYDGQHLTFPWASKDFNIFPDKKNTVWRAIQEGFGLIAHGVGGGKTIVGSAIGLELRRLGLAKKPMIVVHNATLEQFADTIGQIAPAARVLVGRKDELQGAKRKEFLMRIAAGDWDAVVVAHSTFNLIADDPAMMQKQMEALVDEIREALMGEGYSDIGAAKDDRKKSGSVKQLVKMLEELEGKITEASSRRTDTDILNFQQLGVDALIVDEVHKFKKMPFATKLDVKGIDGGMSKSGYGLLMRARGIQEKLGGKNVFTMTGTPVTNTLGEIWNQVRLVAPHLLKEYKVEKFDQFVSKFAVVENSSEADPTGARKMVERLAKIINLPEWGTFFRLAADVKLGDDMVTAGRPEVKGGQPELVAVERSAGVAKWVQYIRQVLAALPDARKDAMRAKDWDLVNKLGAIPMSAYMASRAAAIDIRLVEPRAMDEPGSKVNRMIERALGIYKETREYKGTQVIFADSMNPVRITSFDQVVALNNLDIPLDPKKDLNATFNLYDDIRKKLIKGGVAEAEIAVLTDKKYQGQSGEKAKKLLWEKVNAGEVRFVLGSTEKLGTGVNMQRLMAAAHHLDVPWTPAGLEQRDGRVLRQGNLHVDMGVPIELIRYGMKDTLDEALWEILARKQRFITSALSGKLSGREVEEDELTLSLQQQAAILSGPYGAEMFEVSNRLQELNYSRRAHSDSERRRDAEIADAKKQVVAWNREIASAAPKLAKLDRLSAAVEKDGIQITVDGETFETKKAMLAAVDKVVSDAVTDYEGKVELFDETPAPVLTGFVVNGVPVRLVGWPFAQTIYGEQGTPIGEKKTVSFRLEAAGGPLHWNSQRSETAAVDNSSFGEVKSAGTLVSRIEELGRRVKGQRDTMQANLNRYTALANMAKLGAWAYQAEFDRLTARSVELIRLMAAAGVEDTGIISPVSTPLLGKVPETGGLVKLVKDNIGLAVSIARTYSNVAAPMEDIVSAARVALIKAAKAWDPGRGGFSSYAGVAIRNALNGLFTTERRRREDTTLDAPMADSDLTAKDLVSVNGRESVTAPIEQAETNEALTAAIARLPEYPRAVLFGLMEGRTLEDIARERGVSKQAVGMVAVNARKAALRIMQRAGFKGVDSDGVLLAKAGEGGAKSDMLKPDTEILDLARKDTEALPSTLRMPLDDAVKGVVVGASSPVDQMAHTKPERFAALYDAFANTREALRRKYGDTITLYRAQGSGREAAVESWDTTPKAVLNYASKENAKRYMEKGRKLVSREVSVDDIVAVYSPSSGHNALGESKTIKGHYEEYVVRAKPTPAAPAAKAGFKGVDSDGVLLAKLDETQIADEAKGIMAPDPEPVEAEPVRGQWRDFMTRIFAGRKDRLEYFAPGAWKEVELSEMDGARVRAGVREMMGAMMKRVRSVLGNSTDAAGIKRRKTFVAELLPVAARLNATGRDAAGEFIFDDFDMRAGVLSGKYAEKAGLTTGDVFEQRGEYLKVGEWLEDQKAFQLLRAMDIRRQVAIHRAFSERYPEVAWMLDAFIDPAGAGERVTDARGTVLPAFNRFALHAFFGDVSPHGDLNQVAGYVPEIARTRTLAGAIGGAVQNLLNRHWKSGARDYKTGGAREAGQVRDLMVGFSVRAMEAHAETQRLALAEKLIPIALHDVPKTGVPAGWIAVNPDALAQMANAYGSSTGMSPEQLTKFTAAIVAGDMEALKKLVGAAWAALKKNQMIRKEVFAELVRPLADRQARGMFARIADTLSKSYTAALLAHPFTWLQNQFSNELFKAMRAVQRTLYASTAWMTGPAGRRDAKVAIREAWNLSKGMIVNRWWNPAWVRERDAIVPPEYFQGNTGISGVAQSITEEQMTAADHLKQANVPQALLAFARYGNMDVRAKQALAHASYVAQASVAADEAAESGLVFRTKAQRVAWMRTWLNAADDKVHRRAMAVAHAYAMDYSNVPWWLDDSARITTGAGTDITAPVNTVRRLILPFAKWPYNMARQMKRFGFDSSLDVLGYLVGKVGNVPGFRGTGLAESLRGIGAGRGVPHANPKLANSVAHLGTFTLMLAVMRAALHAPDEDEEDLGRLGRSFDEAGKRLESAYNTSSRVNISDLPVLGSAVRALAKMFGDEDGRDDYWLRTRTIPYAGPMLAMAATQQWMSAKPEVKTAHGEEAWGAWQSFLEDFNSEGVLVTVLNKLRGVESKYDAGVPVTTTLAGKAFDVATARIAPPPLLAAARDFVDPVQRRQAKSVALGFNTGGPIEAASIAVQNRVPGLSKTLPPRGVVRVAGLDHASEKVAELSALGFGNNARRVFVDKKSGTPKVAYVEPEEIKTSPRWRTALRFAGLNIKKVDRAGYKRAVAGEEGRYRAELRKAGVR